jgi:site-specific DNA-methyltransferase (adenine-specific)
MLVKITEVKPNPKNPRIIKDGKFQKLVKSIQEFPDMLNKRPLIVFTDVDNKYVVLGGNMRLKACKEIGLKEIPIIVADEWTEEQKNEFLIKDNVGFGEWDWDSLANEWDVEKLDDWGLDLPVDLSVQEELEAEEDDFDVPEGGIETDIVLGDLFEIGEHRLLCGDSTCSDTVAKLMNGELADMVFTDPPYNANYKSRGENELLRKGIKNDNMSSDDFEDFIQGFVSTCILNIKEGASVYFCCNWKDSYPRFYFNLEKAGINISANIVWNKGSGGMGWQDYRYQYEFIIYGFLKGKAHKWFGGRTETDVWDIKRDNRTDYNHPTQKPIEISSRALKNSSEKNDLIMELFTGSGSTMVASHQLNRKCYGMELDPKYCQVIIDRMKKLDPSLVIKKNGVEIK